MESAAQVFEEHRSLLMGIAYRMLGTIADAEDVVQNTWLKWSRADRSGIRDPRAWLVTACSRLALDVMKSARVRRESYVGVWLPEPLVDRRAPADQVPGSLDETVSVALMLALEKLSPAERAAFLLHDVFDYSFEEISTMLGRPAGACRKLASRARAAVHGAGPRYRASPEEHQRLLDAFVRAVSVGDMAGLKSILAGSVELHADGGGKAVTAPHVLRGADVVAKFFVDVLHERLAGGSDLRFAIRHYNGAPGLLVFENGRLVSALTIAVEGGAIHRVFALRNPDKLAIFRESLGAAAGDGTA